jgi:Carboxypeptidase regulatory-like domain
MKRLLLIYCLLAGVSCGGNDRPPTLVTPTPPTPPETTKYTVSGTVRDVTGAAIADARVFGGNVFAKSGPSFAVQTDSAGRYRGELPSGRWTVSASKPGYLGSSTDLLIDGNRVTDLTLQLLIGGTVTEAGVGALEGATVEFVSGPNTGLAFSTHPVGTQNYSFINVLPGESRIRASKQGYDSVEQTVNLPVTTSVNFTLKWSYGTCLRSVEPVLFDLFPSSGGPGSASVNVNSNRTWSAMPDVPWIEVNQSTSGSGRVDFRVAPQPLSAVLERRGAVMIRCSATEGQNIWISQMPGCQIQLTAASDTPSSFPASGGTGHLLLHAGVPACHWIARSDVDWIHSVGINDGAGDSPPDVRFLVSSNTSGQPRAGSFIVGETPWRVTQQ